MELVLRKGLGQKPAIGTPEDKVFLFQLSSLSCITIMTLTPTRSRFFCCRFKPCIHRFQPSCKRRVQKIHIYKSGNENRSENISVWNNIVRLSNLPVSFGARYQIKVSGKLEDIYGRTLGKGFLWILMFLSHQVIHISRIQAQEY